MESNKLSRRRILQAGACLMCGFPAAGQASVATIHDLSGTVYVNKRKIRSNDRILPGDLVSTSANGRIAFSVDGDAYLMKGFTSMHVGTRDNPIINQLRLLTGKLLAVFETGRQRQLVTRAVTIGIRGTGCFLDASPQTTYYCNCYGKTEIHAGSIVRSAEATHHDPYRIDWVDGHQALTHSHDELDHTDDELRQLESYVGRVPLFDRI